MAKPCTCHSIPPIYRTVHDSAWKAQVSIGLAEYQRPVVRVVNVLDSSEAIRLYMQEREWLRGERRQRAEARQTDQE